MALREPPSEELLGHRLSGEGLDDAGLEAWLADEQSGFAALVGTEYRARTGEVNRRHAFRHLGVRRFQCCLALGAASGGEYDALTGRVARYVAIEPAARFWRSDLAGSPAEYRAPTLRGHVDLPDGTCDLACSFGVLHHIANVSEVLREMARLLVEGGVLVLREPIHSLGDFRAPRRGLTPNERGIPHAMMDTMLAQAGFRVVSKSFAGFPLIQQWWHRLGLPPPWESHLFVLLDDVLCRLTAWNIRYWRGRAWHKAAPAMAYWVAVRE